MTQQRPPQLTPKQQAAYDALQHQRRVTSWPYYSTVKLTATRSGSGAGPFVYTIQQGTKVKAFSYSIDELMTSAGYEREDGVATFAHTNIVNKNETIAGQNLQIYGLAFQWLPVARHVRTDNTIVYRQQSARLIGALHNIMKCTFSLNAGQNQYQIGKLAMAPGAGGLTGQAQDALGQAAFNSNVPQMGLVTNGWPVRSNFFPIPEGVGWNRSGHADAVLAIEFEVTRAIELHSGGEIENQRTNVTADNAAGSVATGVQSYNFPEELVVELVVILIGPTVGPRTRSA